MSANISCIAEMEEELSIDTSGLTGGWDLIGTLQEHPIHIIFDSQSDVSVEIGNDATKTWKTFEAGTAIILDMRSNHGKADNMAFRKGMKLYAKGTAGAAGKYFKISYTYAVV